MKKARFPLLILSATMISYNSHAVEWVRTIDGSNTAGVSGTITLDDWGFVGPQGRQADSFEPYGGMFGNGMYDTMGIDFCIADPAACGVGQRQHVITSGPDGITPDAPVDVYDDFLPNTGDFLQANADSLTTFFMWGYTTTAGSTFNNMMIDFDGDYRIAQGDMIFEWYNTMDYKQVVPEGGLRVGEVADGVYNNSLAFQPYAVSDAIGWCGSVIASHPNAHEAMAGQVKFDIIMDVYNRQPDGTLVFFSSELTPDFEMRSFGDLTVDLQSDPKDGGGQQLMHARAVVNNTDANVPNTSVLPSTPVGDFSWHNRVSFMGGDILPANEWCGIESAEWKAPVNARGPGVKRFASIRKDLTTKASCEGEGGVWTKNAFPGFGYILRADAGRYIDYFDESVYGPDPMAMDADTDGIPDSLDNCVDVANANQLDSDGDNFGNACDADFNNDNFVNSLDIGLFLISFFTPGDTAADLNEDGVVDVFDMDAFKQLFFKAPGPSGTTL